MQAVMWHSTSHRLAKDKVPAATLATDVDCTTEEILVIDQHTHILLVYGMKGNYNYKRSLSNVFCDDGGISISGNQLFLLHQMTIIKYSK
jgi:hypothetical protein